MYSLRRNSDSETDFAITRDEYSLYPISHWPKRLPSHMYLQFNVANETLSPTLSQKPNTGREHTLFEPYNAEVADNGR